MLIEGMEIKVGRGDWLREQRRPEKAEEIARYCDQWWLVTTEGVVADASEIPTAWGWLLLERGGRLKRAKLPERLNRSEGRRVGKEWVSGSRFRWSPYK